VTNVCSDINTEDGQTKKNERLKLTSMNKYVNCS
jgi:hypothetical protein